MSVSVLSSYAVNLVVPAEATGLRSKGVPPGGSFDQRAASTILAATGSAVVIECLAPIRLLSQIDSRIAVLGAKCGISIGQHRHDGPVIVDWPAGQEFELLPGFSGRVTLGWTGLTTHSRLPHCLPDSMPSSQCASIGQPLRLQASEVGTELRVLAELSEPVWPPLEVLPQSDRVGIRLRGQIEPQSGLDRSEPSVQGAIQVTPDGTVLIHGPDGPTIGGYGKIGFVIRADWHKLAHLQAGQKVSFRPVSTAEAMQSQQEEMGHRTRAAAHLYERIRALTAER